MSHAPHTTARRRAWLRPTLVALFSTLTACEDEDEGDDDSASWSAGDEADDSPADGQPSGAAACAERYFSKLSFECATIDCGEALTCETDWECITCQDRCESHSCGSDADCAVAYGDMCSDVEWRCEPYITSDNLRCSAHDVGESRCGDGECTADESCDSCTDDCGYCPGTAPAMAPCAADSDCASGACGGWCLQSCSSGWDCVGDGNGVLYGECILASDDNAYCFPSCTVTGGCASYTGASCMAGVSTDNHDVEVVRGLSPRSRRDGPPLTPGSRSSLRGVRCPAASAPSRRHHTAR